MPTDTDMTDAELVKLVIENSDMPNQADLKKQILNSEGYTTVKALKSVPREGLSDDEKFRAGVFLESLEIHESAFNKSKEEVTKALKNAKGNKSDSVNISPQLEGLVASLTADNYTEKMKELDKVIEVEKTRAKAAAIGTEMRSSLASKKPSPAAKAPAERSTHRGSRGRGA